MSMYSRLYVCIRARPFFLGSDTVFLGGEAKVTDTSADILFYSVEMKKCVCMRLCIHAWVWVLLQKGSLWSVLEKLRDKGSFMPERCILKVLQGICSGLKAMHDRGYAHRYRLLLLLHTRLWLVVQIRMRLSISTPLFISPVLLSIRDLKPTNVLLEEDDRPLLMDLGSMNRSRMEVKGTREAMTVQDWAAQRCTISYRAPELFNVESHCVIDDRTDIWVTHTRVLPPPFSL